jgi:PAS domain S-box-containing protein
MAEKAKPQPVGELSGTDWMKWIPWIPLIVVAILLAFLVSLRPEIIYNSPILLTILNTLFLTIISLMVAILAGQTYLAGQGRSIVLLGCGALSLALGGLLAGFPPGESNPNYSATVYNCSALLASLCHMGGASWFMIGGQQQKRPRGFMLLAFYPAVVVSICLLTTLTRYRLLPIFFIDGVGPTVWNVVVLGSAALLFIFSAILLWAKDRNRSAFVRWYVIGLALIAVGLVGVSQQKNFGDPINWLGRSAQYLGGIYMLIAIAATIRQSGGWEIPLERALQRAELALKESEERMSFALEVGNSGAWDLDLLKNTARRTLVHDQIFGYKALLPEWTYDVFLNHVLPEDRQAVDEAYRRAIDTHTDWSFECRIRRTDGEIRWIWAAGRHRMDPVGAVHRIAGIVQDITERKRTEEALRRAKEDLEQRVAERTAELAQRADQLRALASELTLSEQRERRRMARLLHDHLQQLLVAAKFHTAILSHGNDEFVKRNASEIEELLDECINASRSLTAELSPPILHEAGLQAGLEWVARWMSDKHGLSVELSIQDEPVPLTEDVKILLFEAVRELLFNAAKHSRTRSAAVSMRQVNGELKVVVSDRGAGFDPTSIPPVVGRGSGFGLFSIRERLDLIGGQFEIESSPGKGSRFVLTAPLDTALSRPVGDLSPVDKSVDAPPPMHDAPIRVLIADDHAVMRDGLSQLLSRESDIRIVGEAADGLEAVELAGRLMPDVILMDLSMPKLNGIEATRTIRKTYPGIRIIGLSMFEESERSEALRDAGAFFYLTKSGPSEDVIAAIRLCMNRPG